MASVEFLMTSFDHAIYYLLNFIFDTMPAPESPAVQLPENSFFGSIDEINHHLDVRASNGPAPLVQGDSAFMTWFKMLALYNIWGWISFACPGSGLILMGLTNDGGVFYNECYYMFYNGVVWYNPPAPYSWMQGEETA